MGDKDKAAKDWVEGDTDTDDLVKKSFEAGDADRDWDETQINPDK
jgi:hypothetical protein